MINKRFDWFKVLHNEDLTSLADKLSEHVLSTYSDETQGVDIVAREEKVRHISNIVISALYSAYFTRSQHKLWVSYPLSPSSYSVQDGSNNKIKLSQRIALKVFHSLGASGWIKTIPAEIKKHFTLMYPSSSLSKELDRIGFVWMPQDVINEGSLVELKDVKRNKKTGKAIRTKGKTTKFKMPVPSTAEVAQHRNNLYKINTQLVRHCITMDLTNSNLNALEKAIMWLSLAAVQGYAQSHYYLGVMYEKGRGVLTDYVRAYMWYNIGAYNGENLGAEYRTNITKIMTASQVEKAQEMSSRCLASDYKDC